MVIDQKIRKGVIESLPEAKLIKNQGLRDKVYDAWAMALKDSGYTKIEEMPPSGNPTMQPLKKGTQADHFRCVARTAAAIAQEFNTNFDLNVDMGEVIAGALCHDLGKPFEYANQERWKANPGAAGNPSSRLRGLCRFVGGATRDYRSHRRLTRYRGRNCREKRCGNHCFVRRPCILGYPYT